MQKCMYSYSGLFFGGGPPAKQLSQVAETVYNVLGHSEIRITGLKEGTDSSMIQLIEIKQRKDTMALWKKKAHRRRKHSLKWCFGTNVAIHGWQDSLSPWWQTPARWKEKWKREKTSQAARSIRRPVMKELGYDNIGKHSCWVTVRANVLKNKGRKVLCCLVYSVYLHRDNAHQSAFL